MSKKIKAILTIEVTYEDESGSMTTDQMFADAEFLLKAIADRAANNGQMSGDSLMIVEEWDSSVSIVPVKP